MAINYDRALAKGIIKSALDAASQKVSDPTQSRDDIADAIAAAIDAYVKTAITTATVAFAPGTVVGIAPPSGGAITAGAATEGVIS